LGYEIKFVLILACLTIAQTTKSTIAIIFFLKASVFDWKWIFVCWAITTNIFLKFIDMNVFDEQPFESRMKSFMKAYLSNWFFPDLLMIACVIAAAEKHGIIVWEICIPLSYAAEFFFSCGAKLRYE
jgi:hypothetical protein